MNLYDEKKFDTFKKNLAECRICQSTFGFEPHPVQFGEATAKIMQISQAPSRTVHQNKLPFTDSSGKKLKKDWYQISEAVFYDPTMFYITSVAHCYPGKTPGKGDRRPPKICADKWLTTEMRLVQNEIYIVIGRYAAQRLFPNVGFTELIFEDQLLNGKPAYVLPHPSPLNIRWFKQHPNFEAERLLVIRQVIQNTVNQKKR